MTYFLAIVGALIVLALIAFLRGLGDIHVCARTGRTDRVRDLLEKNPGFIDAVDHLGETPIHKAAKYGELDTLRFLVERGGNLSATSKQGVTPLHLAAAFGEQETVKFLISRGVDVDPQEETGMTPIMAAQAGNHTEIVDILKNAGADADATPAFAMLGKGHMMVPLAPDDPLMRAAIRRAQETVPTLRDLSNSTDARPW